MSYQYPDKPVGEYTEKELLETLYHNISNKKSATFTLALLMLTYEYGDKYCLEEYPELFI